MPARRKSTAIRRPRSRTVSGYGAYKTVTKRRAPAQRPAAKKVNTTRVSALRGIGSVLGGMAGLALGGPAGAALGTALGGHAGGLVASGLGEYKVKRNSLLETNGPPKVVNGNHSMTITHREFIGDVYAPGGTGKYTAFDSQTYPINPGLLRTFPWASPLATNFEQYRIDGMIFEYKSTYSDAVVTYNGSLGTVILATQYNSLDVPFKSKQEMENYEFSQSSKPSVSMLHPVECSRSQTPVNELYVRIDEATAVLGDLRLYDMGKFTVATVGIPLVGSGDTVVPFPIGELWVSYQVTFLKPKQQTFDTLLNKYFREATYSNRSSSTLANVPFPSAMSKAANSEFDVLFTSGTTTKFSCFEVPTNIMISGIWTDPSGATLWGGITNIVCTLTDGTTIVVTWQTSPIASPGVAAKGMQLTGIFKLPARTSTVTDVTIVYTSVSPIQTNCHVGLSYFTVPDAFASDWILANQ